MDMLRDHRFSQMKYIKEHQGAVLDDGWVFTTAVGSILDRFCQNSVLKSKLERPKYTFEPCN